MLQEKWLTDFGSRLRSEREKQGLTQQALAKKAKTKLDYISQLERGVRNPTLRTIINILSALDMSADHLIFGTSKGKNEKKDKIMDEFTAFLMRRDEETVAAYYEIVRSLAKYVDAYGLK